MGRKMSERRQHPRWDGHLLVDLEDHSGLIFEAVGLNISTGGLCMIFPDAPAPAHGAVYGVTLRLPNLVEPIENAVEIRWVDRVRTKLCGAAFIRGLRAREVYCLQELLSLDKS